MTISNDSREYRKSAGRGTHDPEKGIPRLFPEVSVALGTVHQSRRGIL
jgi:hypothetical protein